MYVNQFAVEMKGDVHDADQLAQKLGFLNLGPIGNLENHFLFQATDGVEKESMEKAEEHCERLKKEHAIVWFEQQSVVKRVKRSGTDEL